MAGTSRLLPVDPNQRFVELASQLGLVKPGGAVAPDDLTPMIKGQDAGDVKAKLTQHLAYKTPLTWDAATLAVDTAFNNVGGPAAALQNPDKTAKAVSDAAGASFSGKLDLSDPTMLGPWSRIVTGLVVAAGLILAMVVIWRLDPKSPNWAYGSLAVLGIGCLVGLIVVVMGYKNVAISASGSPPGS